MNLLKPPEIADGGYWYVVPIVTDADGGSSPGVIPGQGWCAWYNFSLGLVAVRCPQPVTGIPSSPQLVAEVISGPKPYGRVGGV